MEMNIAENGELYEGSDGFSDHMSDSEEEERLWRQAESNAMERRSKTVHI